MLVVLVADFKFPALFVLTLKAHSSQGTTLEAAHYEAGLSLRLPTKLENHPLTVGSLLTYKMAKSMFGGKFKY